MKQDDTIDDIKNALNGRPGQPIVFGVCKALAARCECEPWITRAAAVIFGLIWTLPVLAAYVIAGLCMKETETRTKGFFSGLSVLVREWAEKIISTSRRSFDSF